MAEELEGYAEIAAHLQRVHNCSMAVSTLGRLARRAEDPMPVYRFHGYVRVEVKKLDQWFIRQREKAIERSKAHESRT